MNREKTLLKNTVIISIGTICTKLITFLLLPLYTSVLTTEEYGIVDLLNTLSLLLIPIITFQMEQAVFRELIEESHKLPDKYQYKFRQLMDETSKKLNEKPIVVPFSSYEFKYKLSKIKDDIHNGSDVKSKKVMNKLIKEAKRFSNSTNANTI